MVPIAVDDPSDRTVQQISEEAIRYHLLMPRDELMWSEYRAYIEGAVEWLPALGAVAMDDKRCHRSSVVAGGDRITLAQAVGIIDREPPLERDVVRERQSVEQRYSGLAFDPLGNCKARLRFWLKRGCRDAHRSERTHEHDFVGREEAYRFGSVRHHGLNLLDRELDQQRVVLDLWTVSGPGRCHHLR